MDDLHRRLFDELPCYVSAQDRQLRIIAANRMFEQELGGGVGASCFAVYKGRAEKCPNCPVERTFADGRVHTSEEVVQLKNGERIDVIVYTSPIREADGAISAVVELAVDITKVKQLQQKFRTLFDEVPCYISVQDRELTMVEANRRFKHDFGDGIGEKCYQIYKHRTEACLVCPVAQTFQDGEIHRSEEVVTRQDGRPVNVLTHTAAIRNPAGEIESVMEMSTNITELRQLQSQLTSLGLLVGTISHGIKGLLNGLDGGLYLMETGFAKDNMERVRQGLAMTQRNVGGIRSMVLNILHYAKEREIFWQPIDVAELAAQVAQALARPAEVHGVTLRVRTEPGAFEGDQYSIRSLLVNLLENSIDACRLDKEKAEHEVSLAITFEGEQAVFDVRDNGIGMDRETREKAFSLFFSSKGSEGTGLGLFIANKIATAHQGTIEIESTRGVGTRFIARLPRKRPATADEGHGSDEEDTDRR